MRYDELVNESVDLTEDYDDRVDQIVSIIKSKGDKIPHSEVESKILYTASRINAVELRMPSLRKELIKDVKKKLMDLGLVKRAESTRIDPTKDDQFLRKVADAISRYAGEVFPDGDPIDFLIPWFRKQGYDQHDISKILNAAARKYLGVSSYYEYLANLYDDFVADNPGEYGLDPRNNPWRS